MFKKLTTFVTASSLVIATTMSTGCSNSSSTNNDVDLLKVLDVFESSINTFESPTVDAEAQEASDVAMKEFTTYTQGNLNSPSFTPKPVGLELKSDGMFEGYTDKNGNGTRDSGEDKAFTVEVDTENNRLIATDLSGESTGIRFSMAGFLAGMLIGNLLGRQKRAGKSSFKNRNVKSASSYKSSKASSGSSSAKSKSLSGSHTSGK